MAGLLSNCRSTESNFQTRSGRVQRHLPESTRRVFPVPQVVDPPRLLKVLLSKVGGSNGATRLRYHEDLIVLLDPFLILNDCGHIYAYSTQMVPTLQGHELYSRLPSTDDI